MPELTRRHRSLREVISLGVHERGVAYVAGKIDESPSRLSESLSGGTGERVRKFDVDDFERYMKETGDLMPLHYLCAKFLPTPEASRMAATARLFTLAQQLADEMANAGIGEPPTVTPRRRK